jgi:type I restriction enzyme, R subunit
VAVREYPMAKGHGTVDYLLFVDTGPVGVIEAKKDGTPLVEALPQATQATACCIRSRDHRLRIAI